MPDITNAADYAHYKANVSQFMEREGIRNLSSITPEGEEWTPEPYFSWQPCECCGCGLGGNREDCDGWNPTTEEECGPYSVCEDCVYYAEYGRLDDMTMDRVEHSRREEESNNSEEEGESSWTRS